MHLIASYGTLRSIANADALIGRRVGAQLGRIIGWRVYGFAERPYPGVVRDPHAVTHLSVLYPVTDAELAIVDAWEDEYVRQMVAVTLDNSTTANAWLWVPQPGQGLSLTEAGSWSLATWEDYCLSDSIDAAAKFRQAFLAGRQPTVPHNI